MSTDHVLRLLARLAEGQDSLDLSKTTLDIIVSRVLFGENGPILTKKRDETMQYLIEHYLDRKGESFEVRVNKFPTDQYEDIDIGAEQVCLIVQQTLGMQGIGDPANRSLVSATCKLFERIGKTSAWHAKAQEMMAC